MRQKCQTWLLNEKSKSNIINTKRQKKQLTSVPADGHFESSFSMLRSFQQKTQAQKPNSHANIWQNIQNTPNQAVQDKHTLLTAFDDSSDGGQRALAGRARETEGISYFFHLFRNCRPVFLTVFQLHDWKHFTVTTQTTPHPNWLSSNTHTVNQHMQ